MEANALPAVVEATTAPSLFDNMSDWPADNETATAERENNDADEERAQASANGTSDNEEPAGAFGSEHIMVPRATIKQIVDERNALLAALGTAWEKVGHASDAITEAVELAGKTVSEKEIMNWSHSEGYMHSERLLSAERPEHEKFEKRARRNVDAAVWRRIVGLTQLERLMDATAKAELWSQLQTEPPEVTVENVTATIEGFMAEADMIFKRGIAICFSQLDRRFRSHLGFRIGTRIILDNAFDRETGQLHWGRQRDTMIDVERTFYVLDGEPAPEVYGGIIGQIQSERQNNSSYGPRQSTVLSRYFEIRIFKKGTAHLWMRRDDLVCKVNKLLAEYYGEVMPDASNSREARAARQAAKSGRKMAKHHGFYPTPDNIADVMLADCELYRKEGDPKLTVLEPSAGTGALAARASAKGAIVDCIELQGDLAATLEASGKYRDVIAGDFLKQIPGPQRLYDRVIMNPPFDGGLDIDHVRHAMKFLKPDGLLVAIMAAATEFRETTQAKGFRETMRDLNVQWVDLPAGAFSEVGTHVNAIMAVVRANGTTAHGVRRRWGW